MKKIRSWGIYSSKVSKIYTFDSFQNLSRLIKENRNIIAYGNGGSYGDCALSKKVIKMGNKRLSFELDEKSGYLTVNSGVLLSEVISFIVPKGWFLMVAPGTKFISIGGAIASDIHGKNHHIEGCFSESIISLKMMLPDGSILECSKNSNRELFRATCGGMGLTGVILEAKIKLKKIGSQNLHVKTIKTESLDDLFSCFKKYKTSPYSVAWINCMPMDKNKMKGIFQVGKFLDDGDFNYRRSKSINLPFYFPSFVLSNTLMKLFNLIYLTVNPTREEKGLNIEKFFFPLDVIGKWNRAYGKKGFIQYQFVLPIENSKDGLNEILTIIAQTKFKPFLSVLKLLGKENDNYLSFPRSGYTLSLDFKITRGLFDFLDELDAIVIKHKGRIYLAKDARTSEKNFKANYKNAELFREYRNQNNMTKIFNSFQSKRLGI